MPPKIQQEMPGRVLQRLFVPLLRKMEDTLPVWTINVDSRARVGTVGTYRELTGAVNLADGATTWTWVGAGAPRSTGVPSFTQTAAAEVTRGDGTVGTIAGDTVIFDDVDGDWDRSKMNTVDEVAEVIYGAVGAGDEVTDLDVAPPA